MKKLYSFYWDCGRMGDVEGLFIATEKEVNEAIGRTLYLGEILGKHSEVFGELKKEDLKVKSDDQDFIQQLGDLLGDHLSGYNPLDYIQAEE